MGDGVAYTEISHVTDTYKTLAAIPSPVSAVVLPTSEDSTYIHSTWSSRDLIKLEKTNFSREYIVSIALGKFCISSTGISHDVTSVCLSAYSRTGKRRAIMRKKGKSLDDSVYLEVWNASRKENTFIMFDRKEHGKICDNNQFGCLEWSADEKYLLYVAEAKQPKSESYFTDRASQSQSKEEVRKGEEYIFREDWGEALVCCHHLVLCYLEIETGHVKVLELDGKLSTISVGQAIWGFNDESIIFVGWQEFPRRLGLQYCFNRKSAIYSVNLKSEELECLSGDGNISVCSPRFSPDFSTLIYLENRAGGPHFGCSKLMKYDWDSKKTSIVADIVENATGDAFPGIYINCLPKRCWSDCGQYVFFSSPRRSYESIICIDIENRKVQRLEVGKEFGSCHVLDVKQQFITAAVSSPNMEPSLVIGHINIKPKDVEVTWTHLDMNAPVKIPGISWDVISLTPPLPNKKYPDLKYEILVISPEKRDKSQLIVWPHGGPHSAFTASFEIFAACFVKLGYIVCKVNYRGSIGFGQSSISSLLGNIGDQDVHDVQYAAQHLKEELDIGDVFIFGGSHGGFLTAHLCGQYPDYYRAAACRNPVIDVSGMTSITDIPDWTWVEAGHGEEFDVSTPVNPDLLKIMWEKSPIRYVKNVSTPTLLLLGNKDLRVPSAQGFNYYYVLKARGIPVSAYCYDDDHALSKVGVEGDCFVNITKWLKKYSTN